METRHAYSQWDVDSQTGTTPTIVHVTNNNATGKGSFHEAWEDLTGPRIIVFDVGGDIPLSETTRLTDGEVWVAAQTAPCQVNILTDANGFQISDGDVFIQHLLVWNDGDIDDWYIQDIVRPRAMSLVDHSGSNNNWSNVVIDHSFFGGATDQSLNISARTNITVVDSIIADARGSTTYNHAYGGLWGEAQSNEDSVTNVSSIGNIWIRNQRRTPLWRVENGSIVNNIIYDSQNAAIEIEGNGNDGDLTMTFNGVGNWWGGDTLTFVDRDWET
jgi:hypothetical protein